LDSLGGHRTKAVCGRLFSGHILSPGSELRPGKPVDKPRRQAHRGCIVDNPHEQAASLQIRRFVLCPAMAAGLTSRLWSAYDVISLTSHQNQLAV
jgi:hypothetical protein